MCKYLEQRPAWKEFDKEILFSFFQRKCFFLWQNNGYLFVFLGVFFHRLFFQSFSCFPFLFFCRFFLISLLSLTCFLYFIFLTLLFCISISLSLLLYPFAFSLSCFLSLCFLSLSPLHLFLSPFPHTLISILLSWLIYGKNWWQICKYISSQL